MTFDTSLSTYENESKPFVRTVAAKDLFPLLARCEASPCNRITVNFGYPRDLNRLELLRELRRLLRVKP